MTDTALDPIQVSTWQKISELRTLMEKQDPSIQGHLKAIHSNLIQYEELTHLLSDEQIREIIVAQKQVTGQILAPKIAKSAELSTKKLAKNYGSASDL